MQVGVVSDIHANRVALDAVVEDMPPVDRVICAGDVVGYNPWPADCVAAVREGSLATLNDGEPVPTVMGNHDRMVVTGDTSRVNQMARAGATYARNALDEPGRSWLADLPEQRTCFDGRVRVVHGHPEHPDRYTYPAEFGPELRDDEAVLVMGHTHVQYHETYDDGAVLNPGSVGQPRDGDPRAAYAVLDLQEMRVTEHRVEYDVDRVISAVREADLPERIGTRLREGR